MEAILPPFRQDSTRSASRINIDYVKQALLTLVERFDDLMHLAHKLRLEKGWLETKPKLDAASALFERVTALETIYINMKPASGKPVAEAL